MSGNTPRMTAEQAFAVIDQVTAQVKLNRQEQVAVLQALEILKALVNPPKTLAKPATKIPETAVPTATNKKSLASK